MNREPELDSHFECDCCGRLEASGNAEMFELSVTGDWLVLCPACEFVGMDIDAEIMERFDEDPDADFDPTPIVTKHFEKARAELCPILSECQYAYSHAAADTVYDYEG